MKISLPNKVTLFVATLFSLALISLSFLVVKVTAQIPDPKVPCDETENPEFNALRPYQASPCGDYDIAQFCGNQINIVETRSVRRRGVHDSLPVNWWNGGSEAGKDYWIDLSETELPILGNTELTKNSQSNDDLDDATKLNEYVSWYLHGVTNKAQYGSEKNTDTEIVNYSGPIQKLLPSIIQDAQRIATIASASAVTQPTEDEDDPPSADSEPYTHNQIVACASRQILGLIGKMVPHECYSGNGSPAREKVYRLKDWDNHLPPLPWDPQYEGNEEAYTADRCEWEGGSYINVPLINKSICIDNPFNSNEWADLFSYVPLATTPDKKGKMPIFTVTVQPSAADMDVSSWYKLAAPTLYYSHTQEVKDLSETLNKTYVPEGVTTSEIPYETTEKNDKSSDPKCRVVNVRSNPGDDLFPIRTPADIGANVVFHVNRLYNCHTEPDDKGILWTTCSGSVHIGIQTDPNKIPYVNEIWKSTVAGNASTFRKIFPKVEEGAPVSCIADIPGVTKAVYRPVAGTNSIGVEGPLFSPDSENMDPENARIYFSHLGGIYEYFLKGIQTALRPQGFGDPITDGEYCASLNCGELPNLPAASGSCTLGGVSSAVGNIPQSLKQIVEAAAQTYQVPPNLILGIMYGEGLFDGGNKKDWTDENVKNWATCEPVPGCSTSGDDNFLGFFSSDWQNVIPNIEDDLKALDPTRDTPSQCNLLDAIYGLAWNLHDSADGGGGLPATCFGISLNSSVPSSCSWDDSQYEAAIKVSESGYTEHCLTLEGSCATGGGLAAACPGGDNCEKIGNYNPANPSHNACVWNVAHGN